MKWPSPSFNLNPQVFDLIKSATQNATFDCLMMIYHNLLNSSESCHARWSVRSKCKKKQKMNVWEKHQQVPFDGGRKIKLHRLWSNVSCKSLTKSKESDLKSIRVCDSHFWMVVFKVNQLLKLLFDFHFSRLCFFCFYL